MLIFKESPDEERVQEFEDSETVDMDLSYNSSINGSKKRIFKYMVMDPAEYCT